MYKIKSNRQRIIVLLRALYKHTDAKHPLNLVQLNAFLEPYGLCYTKGIMQSTLRDMRAIGIDVRTHYKHDKRGAWMENRPLNDEELGKLIFAVDSNPYLSEEQVAEVLQSLAPLVTVYQEKRLAITTKKTGEIQIPQNIRNAYMVISEAITLRKSVKFRKKLPSTGALTVKPAYFSPKRLLWKNGRFFSVGYHHVKKCIELVDLDDITEIQLVSKIFRATIKEIERAWSAYETCEDSKSRAVCATLDMKLPAVMAAGKK